MHARLVLEDFGLEQPWQQTLHDLVARLVRGLESVNEA